MPLTLDESYVYCQRLSRRTARNFYYSFLTLPRARFRAMCVLYAFMRVTDDLGDSEEPSAARARALAGWRAQLVAACEGNASDHPVLPAVAEVLSEFKIPQQYLLDVIAGVEMDLEPEAFARFDELARYCYHVAGAVGLACIHLWGFHDERARGAAINCGTAFQLTNILRDLREDATRGRIYLPQEDLARFGVTSDDLRAGRRNEAFAALMAFEVARAREHYGLAQSLFDYLDPPGKPILETMLRIYGGLLDEIERRGFDIYTRRIELSCTRKLWIAGGTIVRHNLRRLAGG